MALLDSPSGIGVVARLAPGTRVAEVHRHGDYIQVTARDGRTGWVDGRLLLPLGTAEAAPLTRPDLRGMRRTRRVGKAGAPLKASPDGESLRLVAPPWTTVVEEDEAGEFVKVITNDGNSGWVSRQDLRGPTGWKATPPPSAAARRTVTLPKTLVELLAAYLATFPVGENGLIFTAPAGGPLRATLFRNRAWNPAVAASVGKPCRFHDLRHSATALLIREKVHPKVIQQRLGHASIRTTLDVYGHVFENLDAAAADALDRTLSERAVGFSWG